MIVPSPEDFRHLRKVNAMALRHRVLDSLAVAGVALAFLAGDVRAADGEPGAAQRLKRARELYDSGKFAEVIAACTALVQDNASPGAAYHLRGKARMLESPDAPALALDDFNAAIKAAPRLA